MTTMDDIAARQLQAAAPLVQLGLDLAVGTLGEYLDSLDADDYDDSYIDGLTDAITTLVQAGATDPRESETADAFEWNNRHVDAMEQRERAPH